MLKTYRRFEGADGGRRGLPAGLWFKVGGDAALRLVLGGELDDAPLRKGPESCADEGRILSWMEVEVEKIHEMGVYPAKRVDETFSNAWKSPWGQRVTAC